jgi:tetraprenyl-beta-curcumene synthase
VEATRDLAAALSALAAYLTTVLPVARRELSRRGPLPEDKAKNAEAVAVFATLAPRSTRPTVVRAIVALQVAIDHRDRLEEADLEEDGAYLERLEAAWRHEVAALPAHGAVEPLLERAVARCEEGQRKTHAAARAGSAGLREWAGRLRAPGDYRWWELAAGASSSVAAHALIAAAADIRTTPESASLIDRAYNPPIGALTVFLDDLVDRELDRKSGEHNYLTYYRDEDEAAERLGQVANRAAAQVAGLPRAHRHNAILAGVAAYYLGSPEAQGRYALPIRRRLLDALGTPARILVLFVKLRRRRG